MLRLDPDEGLEALDELVRLAVYHSDALPQGLRPVAELDSSRDAVWSTLFADKALFLNQGDVPRQVSYAIKGKSYEARLVPYRLTEVPR